MSELGKRLREAREQKGLTLEQVESITRIRRVFLAALEEERFEALPGEVYARGFIRNYARLLELDPDELVSLYPSGKHPKLSGPPAMLDEPLARPLAISRRAVPWVALVALLLLLAGGYAYSRLYLGVDPWQVAKSWWPVVRTVVPQETTPASTPALAATSTSTLAAAPAVITAAPPSPQPLPTATTLAVLPTATSTATFSPTATTSPTPTMTVGVRVEGIVTADTYLEVTIDGARTVLGVLRVGEQREWTARESIGLRVGNAAGLDLKVNGVAIGSLGASGEVVTVEYRADRPPTPRP